MFKQFLQHIPGADVYMIASLALFLVFFLAVGWYLITADKTKMDEMAQIPLGSSNDSSSETSSF
jgi:cbb3-type cytochrome oxidase subunit 3